MRDRKAFDDIARRLLDKPRVAPKLTFDTTAGGLTDDTADAAWSNPMSAVGDIITGGESGSPAAVAIGTAGQILTVENVAGDLVPRWQTATPPAAVGQYRGLVFAADGSGSFVLVTATDGAQEWPVTALYDLE